MNNANSPQAPQRHRIRLFLIPGILLAILLLPVLLRLAANRVVLPAKFNDPDCPLISGSISRLGYTLMTADDLAFDTGSRLQLRIPRAEVAYSPFGLLRKRLKSAHLQIASGPGVEIEAHVGARNICFSTDGLSAAVTGACTRLAAGPLRAGPFSAAAEVNGTDIALAFDVPLQDGLLNAQVALNADWKTNMVYHASAAVPLIAGDGAAVQLESLLSGVDDLRVSGQIEAVVAGDAEGTEGAVSLEVDTLEMTEHRLSLSNLNTMCIMRFPGGFRSLPEQLLTADRLSIGELQLDNICMHYQLEPQSVLYVEDLEFEWCDGRVSLYNTRFGPMTTHVNVRLFCDRLSLEQVLSACGLENFSSGGELNGRLPLRWTKEGVTIDRGFLFTTPGREGTFAFGSAEVAADILPPEALEAGQVGLVTAALAEFRYDWITMSLNSEGEDLKIVIESAGQPVNVLPYEYDAKRGTYVKVALRPGRGTRQPMHIQLNLTVPLNRLLCYLSGMNRQWKLFKTNP